MIRSCLPVFLALVMVGCSSSVPKSIANDSGTIGDSVVDNIASESDTFTAVSVGDYIVEIPSSWTNDKDFYYAGDVGTLPYIYVSFSDDYSIDDLVGDPDGFIDGSFSNFEDAKLTSGMSPVDYDYSSGYSYSFSATVQGYDTNNIFTFFENPSGGVVNVSMMQEGYDYLPLYYNILNTVKTEIPFPEYENEAADLFSTDLSPAAEEADQSSDSDSSASSGERHALKNAMNYLSFAAFSYSGLIKQLEYEGFTHEEAVYGADHCGADWKEQAVKRAAFYLEYSSFSRDGLIEQLEYDGFTHEEAEYGVAQSYD